MESRTCLYVLSAHSTLFLFEDELSQDIEEHNAGSLPVIVCQHLRHFGNALSLYEINYKFTFVPLCLSLQWRITHARPTRVSMEGAACRRGMAIAATVLRATLERAARSVSHCGVGAERGEVRGQQLNTDAVSLWNKGKRDMHMLA